MPSGCSTPMMRTGDAMHAVTATSDHGAFFPRFPPEWAQRAPSRLWLWIDRQRQREALAELDDRLLADIGVNRVEAEAECARWD